MIGTEENDDNTQEMRERYLHLSGTRQEEVLQRSLRGHRQQARNSLPLQPSRLQRRVRTGCRTRSEVICDCRPRRDEEWGDGGLFPPTCGGASDLHPPAVEPAAFTHLRRSQRPSATCGGASSLRLERGSVAGRARREKASSSQVPKCEGPGAPSFMGGISYLLHRGHPPMRA